MFLEFCALVSPGFHLLFGLYTRFFLLEPRTPAFDLVVACQRGARDIATKASTLCLAARVQGNFLGCLVRFHLWILLVKPGLPLNEPMHPESAPAICVRQVFVNLAAFGITEGCFRDDCRSLTVAFADFAR